MTAWIVKSEPEAYSWDDLVRDGKTAWTGVRNYTARNNLMAMKKGDRCFFYLSQGPKELVGIAEVAREHYPDPTSNEPKKKWVAVDLTPKTKLKKGVTLAQMKAHKTLANMQLVKMSRLSVSPVTAAEEKAILGLAQ